MGCSATLGGETKAPIKLSRHTAQSCCLLTCEMVMLSPFFQIGLDKKASASSSDVRVVSICQPYHVSSRYLMLLWAFLHSDFGCEGEQKG